MDRRAFLKASFWSGVAIGVAPAFVRSGSLMLLVPTREIVEVPWKGIIVEHALEVERMVIWARNEFDQVSIVSGRYINPTDEEFDKYLEELTWNKVRNRS